MVRNKDIATSIIFLHYTDDDYLRYSIRTAAAFNKESAIFLLSPFEKHKKLYPEAQHHFISKYENLAKEFRKLYQHYSPNSHDFELRCLERWFVISSFCKENRIENFLYLDSDVLLFTSAKYFKEKIKKYHFTISQGRSPQYMYVEKAENMDMFCQFISQQYLDKGNLEKMTQNMDLTKEGVSDMTFFQKYASQFPDFVAELTEIRDGKTFDNNMNNSDGYSMNPKNGLKMIKWDNGSPSGLLLTSNTKIIFLGLHFQGNAKIYMHRFCDHYTKKSIPYFLAELKLHFSRMKQYLFPRR
jgi:hypothetical protein